VILVHHFQEARTGAIPRNTGTETHTRSHAEASDADAFSFSVTTLTTNTKEAPSSDFVRGDGAVFPQESRAFSAMGTG
jgi:hypothetical protein